MIPPYPEIICHLRSISSLETEYLLSNVALSTFPENSRIILMLELTDPERKRKDGESPSGVKYSSEDCWIYGQANYKRDNNDDYNWKFSVPISSMLSQRENFLYLLSEYRTETLVCLTPDLKQLIVTKLNPSIPVELYSV